MQDDGYGPPRTPLPTGTWANSPRAALSCQRTLLGTATRKEPRMTVESDKDLAALRDAGRVVRLALEAMKANLQPGMTTAELDAIGAEVFERHGARSAPQLVYNFPGVNCISINDEAVHGIPGGRVIEPGDLIKIDVTAELDGYIADAALTVALPGGPALHEELRDCAEAAFGRAVAVART